MQHRKREPQKRKPIKEVDAKKNYSGEASPYWDFIADSQDQSSKENKINEDPLANPDVYSEEETLYARPLSADGEIRLQAIQETLADLTERQREILHLCGNLGLTEEAAAERLKITRDNVHMQLVRARAKVQQRYDKLKAKED
jgi:RNA polymerase sigma factor (sigma-70 family)